MAFKPTRQVKPRTPEESRRYFSQPGWAMKNIGPLPEISPEELKRMTIKIVLGETESDRDKEQQLKRNAVVLMTDLLGEIVITQCEGGLTQTAFGLLTDLVTIRRGMSKLNQLN